MSTTNTKGFVSQIIGPVIDVEFPEGYIPKIYNALKVVNEKSGEILIAEVQYLIGENKARAICMTSTDGLNSSRYRRSSSVIILIAQTTRIQSTTSSTTFGYRLLQAAQ